MISAPRACWWLLSALTINLLLFTASMRAQDTPELRQRLSKRIVYSLPGMDKITPKKDVVYKHDGAEELKLDVYAPPKLRKGEKRAAVLLIHGGPIPASWQLKPKDWGIYQSYGQLLAASGFVAVTFNHRLYSVPNIKTASSDVNDLIAYVRANAEQFGIDPERLTLWAFSGGGVMLSTALRETPAYVRCLVSYYSYLDVKPLAALMGTTVADEVANVMSPVEQLAKGKSTAPLFVARAGLDTAAMLAATDRFIQSALTANLTIEVSNHANGKHGFDVQDDNDRSREIIRRTIEFIQTHTQQIITTSR